MRNAPLQLSLTRSVLVALWSLLVTLGVANVTAQNESGAREKLKPGAFVEGSLVGGEVHRYRVSVKANHLLRVKVQQNGVDVEVRVSDPTGKLVGSVDSPNGANGPEAIDFIAGTSGTYLIGIVPLDSKAAKGNYTISVEKPRISTPADRTSISLREEAKRLFAEAEKLRRDENRERRLEAIKLYRQAADRYRELKDGAAESYCLFNAGLTYLSVAERKLAADALEESLRADSSQSDPKSRAAVLALIAKQRTWLGQWALAIERYVSAIELQRKLSDREGLVTSLNEVAFVYYSRGMQAAAIKAYEEVLALRQSLGDEAGVTSALRRLGSIYTKVGEVRKGVELLDQALALSLKTGDKKARSEVLVDLAGSIYYDAVQGDGKYEESSAQKAIDRLNEALAISREVADRDSEIAILGRIARNYAYLRKNNLALDYYHQAQRLAREKGVDGFDGPEVLNIAHIYVAMEDWSKALSTYKEASDLFAKMQYPLGQAEAGLGVARVYYDLGAFDKSLEHTSWALERGRSSQEILRKAYNLMGMAYSRRRDHRSLEYFTLALKLALAEKDRDGEASMLSNIGAYYEDVAHQYPQALDYYEKALAIHQKIGSVSGAASDLTGLASVNASTGDLEKAKDLYLEAVRMFRQLGDREKETKTLGLLAGVWKSLGENRLAIFYSKQAINRIQERRVAISSVDEGSRKAYLVLVEPVYRMLADALIEEGQFTQADRVLSLLKQDELSDFTRRDSSEIAMLGQKVTLTTIEKALLERYNLLAGRITEISEEFLRLDDKKRTLSRNNLSLSEVELKRHQELETNLSDANAAFQLFVTKELVGEVGKQKKDDIEIDRSLQDKLRRWGKGTVALNTIAGPDRYRVVLTTPAIQIDGKTEIKASELNKKIFAFRSALQNPKVDPRRLGKELYDILVKPIENQLRAVGAQTLLWSLDGSLRYLPLAALSPDGKRYFGEGFQNVLITAKTRDDLSGSNSTWRALGVGVSESQTVAPAGEGAATVSFSALPGAELELKAIVRDGTTRTETGVLPGKRLVNAAFSESAFKDAIAKENAQGRREYNILHIASHFRLGSNWSDSFLLLGNGDTLTLEEINNSPTLTFGDAELITLSACNTAIGEESGGKEVESLASVIQTKSAKAILATLWPVADESTQLLMSEFYSAKKSNPKLTKAAAMQVAQLAMINGKLRPTGKLNGCRAEQFAGGAKQEEFKCDPNAPYSHPYFWSPFVLIGNWR